MRKAYSFVPALLSVLALGCGELATEPGQSQAPPAAAVGGPVTIDRNNASYTFSGYAVGCTGELFSINGTQEWQYHMVRHPSGDWQYSGHDRIRMEGTGIVTGAKYIGNGNGNVTQNFAMPQSGAFTFTQSFHLLGITQGPGDNSSFRVHAKWTIDASGKVAVEWFKVESVCHG